MLASEVLSLRGGEADEVQKKYKQNNKMASRSVLKKITFFDRRTSWLAEGSGSALALKPCASFFPRSRRWREAESRSTRRAWPHRTSCTALYEFLSPRHFAEEGEIRFGSPTHTSLNRGKKKKKNAYFSREKIRISIDQHTRRVRLGFRVWRSRAPIYRSREGAD